MTVQPWPWPADTPLERVKRLAKAYRDALVDLGPAMAEFLDEWAVQHGEAWVVGGELADYDDDDLLTFDEVAVWAGVKLPTVYQWHYRGLPVTPTVDGKRVRKGDLVAWERDRRVARLASRNHPPG